MEIKPCKCGSTPTFVKLFPNGRYSGFFRCSCGKETRVYASKQSAVRAWNGGRA